MYDALRFIMVPTVDMYAAAKPASINPRRLGGR